MPRTRREVETVRSRKNFEDVRGAAAWWNDSYTGMSETYGPRSVRDRQCAHAPTFLPPYSHAHKWHAANDLVRSRRYLVVRSKLVPPPHNDQHWSGSLRVRSASAPARREAAHAAAGAVLPTDPDEADRHARAARARALATTPALRAEKRDAREKPWLERPRRKKKTKGKKKRKKGAGGERKPGIFGSLFGGAEAKGK